jgi:hypothetical protein
MLKGFIAFFIFCLVLFIYLHVHFHLKVSNDLEVYEIDQGSKDKLEEICDLRQPVIFEFDSARVMELSRRPALLTDYPAFELKIRNVALAEAGSGSVVSEPYVTLPLHAADKLFGEDTSGVYYTENNAEFLDETGVRKTFQHNDAFLRPYMVSNCSYDILFGSEGAFTPFRYEINYRNFFLVTDGMVEIKMAPPKSTKYLSPVYDYEEFEFRSPVNAWNPQTQYVTEFDKIKCLEVKVQTGQTIHIPAYWWYSIKLHKNASVSCFRYRTYMNNVAISPYIAMYTLQINNVKRQVVKTKSEDDDAEHEDEKVEEQKVEEQNTDTVSTRIDI